MSAAVVSSARQVGGVLGIALLVVIIGTPTGATAATDIPRYTDVQRIFNKSCIECHGGLDYPSFAKFSLDPTSFAMTVSSVGS